MDKSAIFVATAIVSGWIVFATACFELSAYYAANPFVIPTK